MKIPLFSEPDKWEARKHIGVDYDSLSPFAKQVLDHFDVAEQQIEFAKRRALVALIFATFALIGVGVIVAAIWPAATPVIQKLLTK